MKCGGLRAAYVHDKNGKGTWYESNDWLYDRNFLCSISGCSQLSPLVDWADLDGNLLIDNDVFEGVTVVDGKITLNDSPGIGIKLRY